MTQTTSRPAVDGPAEGAAGATEDHARTVSAADLQKWTADLTLPADVDEVLAALVRRRAPTWVMQRLSRLPVTTTIASHDELRSALHATG